VLPERPPSTGYQRPDRSLQHEVPDHAATLEAERDGAGHHAG
jgi:polyphosphate kinase